MAPANDVRACLKGYKLVEAETPADMACFERVIDAPGAACAGTPRE